MNQVTCPICGSPMVLRTARTGRNAGNRFYGCSRYPLCRGIRELNQNLGTAGSPSANAEPTKHNNSNLSNFPRNLVARSKFLNQDVRFFESVATKRTWIDNVINENAQSGKLNSFSQWRVDFPINPSKYSLDQDHRRILSVAEKILTRGKVTLLQPQLEQDIESLFPETDISPLDKMSLFGWNDETCGYSHPWLDSDEEKTFYEEILPSFLSEPWHEFVIPQIDISCLLKSGQPTSEIISQRIDFLISFPWNDDRIVVEIDGPQHQQHLASDQARDSLLIMAGYTVIRIPTHEIQTKDGPNLANLSERLIAAQLARPNASSSNKSLNLTNAFRIAHQIQIVLLLSLQLGLIDPEKPDAWHIISDLERLSYFDTNVAITILRGSVNCFLEFYIRLCRLYSIKLQPGRPKVSMVEGNNLRTNEDSIFILLGGDFSDNITGFHVQNIYVPFHIANSSFPALPLAKGLDFPNQQDLVYFLDYFFRKTSFWEGQFDAIARTLQGKDTLVLLPTGAGKSLIYQMASLLLPGRSIVIDPIISLIDDQIDNLSLMGIDRCLGITSQINNADARTTALQLFGQGEYILTYIAPERFQTIEFRNSLRMLTVFSPIAIVAVDEAHCISEWGHDFRTAYLNIGRTSRYYCSSKEYIPPLIALTGTASRAVLKDIQRELQIEDFEALITPRSFDRPELKFHILVARSDEKRSRLSGLLGQQLPGLFNMTSSNFYQKRELETKSGIVFCPWVNGEYGVVQIANYIASSLSISTDYYSGTAPRQSNGLTFNDYRRETAFRFKHNDIPLLIATNAFGMGIDKANIRYTVHFGVPQSIESFYQEAGRAGRDRSEAHCFVIVSVDDTQRADRLLNPNTPVEEISQVIQNIDRIDRKDNDDITRNLYFHTNSFRGIEKEKLEIKEVLNQIGEILRRRETTISFPSLDMKIIEKALHRLLIIGVIEDYTINYSSKEFGVRITGSSKEEVIESYGKYVAGYLSGRRQVEIDKAAPLFSLPHNEFIINVIDLLLHFIYEVIERGRRRAQNEMRLVCTISNDDKDIRKRILDYFGAEYSEMLEELLVGEKAGMGKCREIFNSIRSPNEASEIRGQTSRYLESYPDHPGLLMLRFLSEIMSRDANPEVARQNFNAAVASAKDNYALNPSDIIDFTSWAIPAIQNRHPFLASELISEVLAVYPTQEFARDLITKLPNALAASPAWFLLKNLQKSCELLILGNGG